MPEKPEKGDEEPAGQAVAERRKRILLGIRDRGTDLVLDPAMKPASLTKGSKSSF